MNTIKPSKYSGLCTRSILFIPIILAIFFCALFIPQQLHAAVADWQKGASIAPSTPYSFSTLEFRRSIRSLKATGATYVSLVIPYYVSSSTSSIIVPGWDTPTDESLMVGIQYAHSHGLRVMLTPHINIYGGLWRAAINPVGPDRNVWFSNYLVILQHYADIAAINNVEELCIGTELISLSSATVDSENTNRWNKIIDDIRVRYPGSLTYGANWGGYDFAREAAHIQFWNKLDYIGLSAYYTLGSSLHDEITDLITVWRGWDMSDIKPLHDQFQKPIIFTEAGYKSTVGSHIEPWNAFLNGESDENEQAENYSALFSYWSDRPYLAGVFIWNWDISHFSSHYQSGSYSPQFKKAEKILTNWFSSKQ